MLRIIRTLVAHHEIIRVKAHLWVSVIDGEGWKSATDAAVHVVRVLVGA